MIELLVLIVIATIGVVFTSSTGEAESHKMAQKTAKEALQEAEGQHGIGILGIDVVARKARQMLGRSEAGQELGEDLIAAEAIATNRDDAGKDATRRSDMPDAIAQALDETGGAAQQGASHDVSDDFNDFDEALETRRRERADSYATAQQDDQISDHDESDDRYSEWQKDAQADARHERETLQREAAPVVPRRAAGKSAASQSQSEEIDTANAPLVEEFDPTQDQIVIGYRPGEAGNGRIGIVPDPLRDGAAAVTLGGRCVAVVLNALGTLKAHHVDLVCEDDDDIAA